MTLDIQRRRTTARGTLDARFGKPVPAICIRFHPSTFNAINRIAEAEDLAFAAAVRRLVERAIALDAEEPTT